MNYSEQVLAREDIVGYWRFGEKDPTKPVRDGRSRSHGTVLGALRLGDSGALAGDANTAFGFNGSDAGVEVADADWFDLTDGISVAAWIRPDVSQSTYKRLVEKSSVTSWYFGLGAVSRSLAVWLNDTAFETGADQLAVGQWQQVGFDYDRARVRIIHNGLPRASFPYSSPIGIDAASIIMGRQRGVTTNSFSGGMDEVAIYGRALTDAEWLDDYEAGSIAPLPRELSALGQTMLDDLPVVFRDDPDIQGILHCYAKESERVDATLDRVRDQLFPTKLDTLGLPFWEAMLRTTIRPASKTVVQRRDLVLSLLRKLKSTPAGSDWEDNVTALVGPGWSYAEHDPTDPASPPPYTLRINLPFPPSSGLYPQAEQLLRDITPANLVLDLGSEGGFELDASLLDQDPFHPA